MDYPDQAWSDEFVSTVWKWTAPPSWGPYPGRDAALVVLLRDAWQEHCRVMIRRARRSRWRSRIGLLLLLLRHLGGAREVWPLGASRGVALLRPQVGHGVLAPVRGSPTRGAFALALPGARPPT